MLEKIQKKKENPDEAETISNTIMCLQMVMGVEFKARDVDVAIVSERDRRVRRLNESEIDEYLTSIAEKD
jgi:hypothetical protein